MNINTDSALQERMRTLLKERFQGVDIANPLLLTHDIEAIDELPLENHTYVGLLKNGVTSSAVDLESREIIKFENAVCVDYSTPLRDIIFLLFNKEIACSNFCF